MRLSSFLLIAVVLGVACQSPQNPMKSSTIVEISNAMSIQEKAWNEGNLEQFMEPYWHSDSLQFIGKRGITHGWQATLDNYKKGYPDREAMGTLQFTNLSIDALSDSSAYVIGKWELFRTADTLSGHYSLLWKKMGDKWQIVADHSS